MTVGRVNDLAYGNYDGRLERTLQPLPNGILHGYRVDHDGKPAAVALALHHNGDCGVSFVATVPKARRQGLGDAGDAAGLSRAARNDGCTTTTLQATDVGERLYTSAWVPASVRDAALGAAPVARSGRLPSEEGRMAPASAVRRRPRPRLPRLSRARPETSATCPRRGRDDRGDVRRRVRRAEHVHADAAAQRRAGPDQRRPRAQGLAGPLCAARRLGRAVRGHGEAAGPAARRSADGGSKDGDEHRAGRVAGPAGRSTRRARGGQELPDPPDPRGDAERARARQPHRGGAQELVEAAAAVHVRGGRRHDDR